MSKEDTNSSSGLLTSLFGSLRPGGKSAAALAEKVYRSEDFESLRKAAIAEGAVPWSILRYEHVIAPEETPVPLAPNRFVTPELFLSHVRFLKKNCTVLKLSELLRLIILNEEIPERAVALTFDHAHASIFLNAFPILLDYDIPATICLPTGYVGSQSYLLNDRFLLAMLACKRLKQPFPKIEQFGEEVYAELEQLSPKLEVTPALMGRMLTAYQRLPEIERVRIMQGFAEGLSTVVGLPEHEDFLRWEDVEVMREHGMEFAAMGHAHLIATQTESELFTADVHQGIKDFIEHEIPLEKYFCLVEGVFSSERLVQLHAIGYKAVLSIGEFPHPEQQASEPKIFGRIPIWNTVASSEALFACRLFRVRAEGMVF